MSNSLLFLPTIILAFQQLFDSEIILILAIICIVLVIIIIAVGIGFYRESKEINRMLTNKAVKWAKKPPPPKEKKEQENPIDDRQITLDFSEKEAAD
jgi:cell division protein FtsN